MRQIATLGTWLLTVEREMHEVGMAEVQTEQPGYDRSLENATAQALVQRAFRATRRLVRLEIALAKNEMQQQLKAAQQAAVGAAIAFAAFTLALNAALIAVALTSDAPAQFAAVFAAIALCVAVGAAVVGYRVHPGRLLARTQKRVDREIALLARRAR